MDNNFSNILGIFKKLDESTMASAEQHSTGPKFVGKMKGTDPASARYSKLVGECDGPMTLADKLRARWEQTKAEKGLQEYGMTTGGTVLGGGTTPNSSASEQAKTAQQVNQTQQNLNKLKSAGVQLPTSVSQAAKSTVASAGAPANATGAGMDQDAKKTAMSLGQEMEKLVASGNPNQVQQVANVIKQAKMDQK